VEGGRRGQIQMKVSDLKVRHEEFGKAFLDPRNTNPWLAPLTPLQGTLARCGASL
jgi:hypothetical protein